MRPALTPHTTADAPRAIRPAILVATALAGDLRPVAIPAGKGLLGQYAVTFDMRGRMIAKSGPAFRKEARA